MDGRIVNSEAGVEWMGEQTDRYRSIEMEGCVDGLDMCKPVQSSEF
jgi:hypothetical protein